MSKHNDRIHSSVHFVSLLPIYYSPSFDLSEISGINTVECVYLLPDKVYATLTPCSSSRYFLLNDTLIDQDTGYSRKLKPGYELVHLRIVKIPDEGYRRTSSKSPEVIELTN